MAPIQHGYDEYLLKILVRPIFLSAFLLAIFTSHAVLAQDHVQYYEPIIDITSKFGTNRSLGTANLMLPLKQTKDVLLFADLRTVLDDQENYEGNAGFGYRQALHLENYDAIFGTYTFFDLRRSQFDNYFSQITAGTEGLTENWAGRANFYLPVSGKKNIFDNPDTASLTPEGFVLINPNSAVEKGLRGFDLELGGRIKPLGETWVHGGYYKFGLGDDNIDLNGVRFRAHTQITDWLRVGVESSYDDVRGSNHFAEIRFRIPIGSPKKKAVSRQGIYRYMQEPIVRDIDIVTASASAAAAPAMGPGGKPEKYVFVDNSVGGGGNGTPGNPYNNLASAIAAVSKDNTIFVRQGDGTTANLASGITLNQQNLRFIGSGVNLTTRQGLLVESATVQPHITNTAGDAVTIAQSGVEVAGFSVDSPLFDGIFALNQDNANIHHNTVNGAGNNGINAAYTDNKNRNVTIANNTTNGNFLRGIRLRSFNGADVTASLANNTANANGQPGIQIEAGSTNSIMNVTASGNTTNSNGGSAGLYVTMAGSSDLTLNLSNHIANSNAVHGVLILTGGTGTHGITANNVSASSNTQHGISVDIQDTTTATVSLTNTTATSNVKDGLNIISRSGTSVTATVTEHASTGNGNQGIDIAADGTTNILNVTLNNVTSSTSLDGITLAARTSGTLNATLLNSNVLNGNMNAGLSVSGQNTANIAVKIDRATISNNGTNSFLLLDTTTGTYNTDFGGGSLGSLGQNRIYGGGNFDILGNLNGTNIFAQSNWWGVATGLAPARVSLTSGGSIDSTSFLTIDPGP